MRSIAIARRRCARSTLEERLAAVPFLGGAEVLHRQYVRVPWIREHRRYLGKEVEQAYPKLMARVTLMAARPAVARALATLADVRAQVTAWTRQRRRRSTSSSARGAFVRA